MKTKELIYKVLNLEKGEGKLVFLPLLYSFFAGASLAFFVTSSTALFLNIFERDMLSVAFIAAGIIVWLVGQIFSFFQKKSRFKQSKAQALVPQTAAVHAVRSLKQPQSLMSESSF